MTDERPVRLAQAPPFRLGALTVTPATRQVEGGSGRPQTLEPRVKQVQLVLDTARAGDVGRDDLLAR